MKLFSNRPIGSRHKPIILLSTLFLILLTFRTDGQKLPRALIITGNGNVPSHKPEYPTWIHEFHNEKVIEILKNTATVDVATDLSVLQAERLREYDLIISNSLFAKPRRRAGRIRSPKFSRSRSGASRVMSGVSWL